MEICGLLSLAEPVLQTNPFCESGARHCLASRLFYPGRFRHVPGLVYIASDVIHQRYASGALSGHQRRTGRQSPS